MDDKVPPFNQVLQQAAKAVEKTATTAQQVVEEAMQYSTDAMGKAQANARSLREEWQPTLDSLSASAQRLAARSRAAAQAAQEQTGEKIRQYADKTSDYVKEKPLQSIAIAAAVGAALALLLGRKRD